MNVDVQFILNGILVIAMAMGGWIMGRITKSLDTLDSDVRQFPKLYVSRDDFNRDIDRVLERLDQIYEKLDGKADKTRP